MAIYRYRAKNGPQKLIENIIEAHSEQDAIDKISRLGYFPVSVELEASGANVTPAFSVNPSVRINFREITILSRQLASLLKSGVPILTSLNIIAEQCDNNKLKGILANIHNAVKDGATFSSALAAYPGVFPRLYVAMVRAGEDSGALPEVLLRIADYRTKQEEIVLRLRTAMAYPVLMAVVGLGTVIFMLTYVMPRLMGIFSNMGGNLPLPTRILIFISGFLSKWWAVAIAALGVVILVTVRYARTKAGRISLGLFTLHLPLVGKLVLKAELARFSRTLELLIKSGIPILRAIDIVIPVLNNKIIQDQLKVSYKDLEQGGSLGKSLKNSKLFPIFMSNLIIVGEESGKLNEALSEVAQSYERDTDEAIKVLASLLEPAMILIMGVIVGFIVVAMLLPIFEINMMVK